MRQHLAETQRGDPTPLERLGAMPYGAKFRKAPANDNGAATPTSA